MTEFASPPSFGDAPARNYNTLSIVGFVLAFVLPVAGIVCSHIALSQVKQTHEEGHGLALAGVIVGYALTTLIVAIVVVSVLIAVSVFSSWAVLLHTFSSSIPQDTIQQGG